MLRFYNRICFEKQVDRLEIKKYTLYYINLFWGTKIVSFWMEVSFEKRFHWIRVFSSKYIASLPIFLFIYNAELEKRTNSNIVCIRSRWRLTKQFVSDRPVHYQEATDISRSRTDLKQKWTFFFFYIWKAYTSGV